MAPSFLRSLIFSPGHANMLRFFPYSRRPCWRRPPCEALFLLRVTPTRPAFSQLLFLLLRQHIGFPVLAAPADALRRAAHVQVHNVPLHRAAAVVGHRNSVALDVQARSVRNHGRIHRTGPVVHPLARGAVGIGSRIVGGGVGGKSTFYFYFFCLLSFCFPSFVLAVI